MVLKEEIRRLILIELMIYIVNHFQKIKIFPTLWRYIDSLSIFKIINRIRPDEIYNLAAQSHVAVSFNLPEYTTNVDALGTLRILDAIIQSKKKIKFYQAGSSEMFGKVIETPKQKKHLSIPEVPMELQKFIHIG